MIVFKECTCLRYQNALHLTLQSLFFTKFSYFWCVHSLTNFRYRLWQINDACIKFWYEKKICSFFSSTTTYMCTCANMCIRIHTIHSTTHPQKLALHWPYTWKSWSKALRLKLRHSIENKYCHPMLPCSACAANARCSLPWNTRTVTLSTTCCGNKL